MSLFDRVRDTSTTTGTGSLTLSGTAPTGFRTFGSVFANNDRVYYAVAHQTANEWETGFGTYSTTGPALARTVVLASSNAGAAVNFSSGTKDVFCTPPESVFGDRVPEISITGTATATIDRMHVCSGTAADYTVTLPAAANNAGRRLWFRMAAGLTRLVTLDGNASETIDGATTRVMWAGETAELLCDGSNWFKVAGRTKPLVCGMLRNTTQSVANATATKIPLNATVTDNLGLQADLTNTRINVRRTGIYEVVAKLAADATAITAAQVRVNRNGSLLINFPDNIVANGGLGLPSAYLDLTAGDNLELFAFHSSGAARTFYGAAGDTSLSLFVAEVPQW